MRCEDARAHLADHLAGALRPEVAAGVAAHVRTCPSCAAEFEAADDTWQRLAVIPPERPDSAAMRARFQAVLDEHAGGAPMARPARARTLHLLLQCAAAVALLAAGVALGRLTAPPPAPDPQLAEMRDELRGMREMVTLSLLQQQSASERLRGITYTRQLDDPGTDVTGALLDALKYDANDNVRLASIDALKRFADLRDVRQGALDALPAQTSPLVQIALIDFLIEMNGREAADALRRISRDPMLDEAVRMRAAQGLDQIG